jgi:hypothetical protein
MSSGDQSLATYSLVSLVNHLGDLNFNRAREPLGWSRAPLSIEHEISPIKIWRHWERCWHWGWCCKRKCCGKHCGGRRPVEDSPPAVFSPRQMYLIVKKLKKESCWIIHLPQNSDGQDRREEGKES